MRESETNVQNGNQCVLSNVERLMLVVDCQACFARRLRSMWTRPHLLSAQKAKSGT